MKVVILAGGLGTRISEETQSRPKPMVEIGGKPILWHIMKLYGQHGFTEFIICCGYKGYMIKEYFANYSLHTSDVTFDLSKGSVEVHHRYADPWRITLVDTGEETMTGGRILRIRDYLSDDAEFCLTYGDGLSDVDLSAELAFHRAHGKLATVTAVRPPGRFGVLDIEGTSIRGFVEKPRGTGDWISGGFFILSPRVIELIAGDATSWEREPLQELAAKNQFEAFHHEGFWQPMDTLRERVLLEELWQAGRAPWKTWS